MPPPWGEREATQSDQVVVVKIKSFLFSVLIKQEEVRQNYNQKRAKSGVAKSEKVMKA